MLIGLVKQAGLPEFWQLTPGQAREQFALRGQKTQLNTDIHRTEDRRIPGPGPDIDPYPGRARKPAELFPILLWFHGGGFVGDLDTLRLPAQADCIVVAVDYRLARVQVDAVEDSHAAVRWVALHAKRSVPAGAHRWGEIARAISRRSCPSWPATRAPSCVPARIPGAEPEMPSQRKFAEGYLLTVRSSGSINSIRNQHTGLRFAPLVTDDLSSRCWWRADPCATRATAHRGQQ
jgi:hypothetical protein